MTAYHQPLSQIPGRITATFLLQMSVLIQAGVPDCWRGQLWQLFLSSLTAGYNREIRARRYKRLAALVSGPKSKRCLSEHQDDVAHNSDTAFQAQVHPVSPVMNICYVEPVGAYKWWFAEIAIWGVALQRDVEQVEKDLHRTWSQGTLARRVPSEAMLRRVLLAYAHHNPEIGYCQGITLSLQSHYILCLCLSLAPKRYQRMQA